MVNPFSPCSNKGCIICSQNTDLEWDGCKYVYKNHNKEHKMTREDAIKIADKLGGNIASIRLLEALGLLKFEEKKEEKKEIKYCISFDADQFKPNMYIGIVKLEVWPEGLVLWVGGEIVWKSWEEYYKNGDTVVISNVNSDRVIGIIKSPGS